MMKLTLSIPNMQKYHKEWLQPQFWADTDISHDLLSNQYGSLPYKPRSELISAPEQVQGALFTLVA